jgi:hypothetical protein
MNQSVTSTFKMQNGSDSPPITTTRQTNESLVAFRDRHIAALTEAYIAEWGSE